MTQQNLDRMFFEVIRRALVLSQLLPDQLLYQDQVSYDAARKALTNLVDVYGVGLEDSRGALDSQRIVIDLGPVKTGSIGATNSVYFEQQTDSSFIKYQDQDASRDIQYEIRTIASSKATDRLLSSIMDYELGERRYMRVVDDTGNFVEDYATVIFNGSVNVSAHPNLIERLYRFTAVDVFLTKERTVLSNIVPLTTIKYSLYLNPDAQPGSTPDAQDNINSND